MGLGLIALALIIATGARECRTGRLILSSHIDEASRIDIDMIFWHDEEEIRAPIYRGEANFRSPLYIPVLSAQYAKYNVTATFPDGRQLHHNTAIVSGIASTDYVLIGEYEIYSTWVSGGHFNFEEDEESLRGLLSIVGFFLSDIWSCVI